MAGQVKSVGTIVEASATNLTLGVPSVADGDLVIAVIAGTSNGQVPAISGFTQLLSSDGTNFASHRWVGWRIASSEPANYTTTGLSAGTQYGLIFVVSGNTSTPTDVSSDTDKSNSGTTLTCTSISPTVNGDLIVMLAVSQNVCTASGWTGGSLSWSENSDQSSTSASIAIGSAIQAAMAAVAPACTSTSSGFAHMIALAIKITPNPQAPTYRNRLDLTQLAAQGGGMASGFNAAEWW